MVSLVAAGLTAAWCPAGLGGHPGCAPAGDPSTDGPITDPFDPTPPAGQSLNGVYSLGLESCSPETLEIYLQNADLDGVSARAGWDDIQSCDGCYDWSVFDGLVDQAASHGKKVMLRVLAGIQAPEWLYDAGAARFDFVDDNPYHPTYGQTVTMPLPWDPLFLGRWFNLVAHFGARYSSSPAVVLIAVTGPATGGEMHLGDKDNADRWHALGYSNALLIQTWQATIDAFVLAFPNQHRLVAISNPVWFDNPDEVRQAVGAYCAATGGSIQGNWLSAATCPDGDLYLQVAAQAASAKVGFQMLCTATDPRYGGALRDGIDLGLAAGASFLEIYRPDITAFPADITYAHQRLNGYSCKFQY